MNKFQLARTRGAYKAKRAEVLVETIFEGRVLKRYERDAKERGTERRKEREFASSRNARTSAGDERFVRISTIHVIVNNII